ncbi:Fucoxanthin-chlorophyll a-c binding protein [Seminavis robusta]|uniref:Fucoxanthin-chlorophyll a-c binding protein n=1 Tax=Seminavis robusta TaxID=568900 RepID=A0A9N8DAY9_9STRA|nr:Fucoxanthin-chlorophyll a-c binding protein [Seminavis robusta]|eukprot:Sro63_g035900.1 Fucoxanthin-chlorophyll a-c binding protein (200) ;mRNA; r:82406-83104
MKTFCAILLAVSGASAFAPAQTGTSSSTRLAATEELAGLRSGAGPETAGQVFDPAGLAEWAPVDHLRKAELSNGRSAMLATVGWLWPKYVGTFESDDVTTLDPIKAIMEADPQWWAQWIIFCGAIEGIKYRAEAEGKSFTGDGPAAIDWTGQWGKMSAAEQEDMAVKELKNARLAMIGMGGFIANYFIPGSVPGMPEGW